MEVIYLFNISGQSIFLARKALRQSSPKLYHQKQFVLHHIIFFVWCSSSLVDITAFLVNCYFSVYQGFGNWGRLVMLKKHNQRRGFLCNL